MSKSRNERDKELQQELHSHLQMAMSDRMDAGQPREQARATVQREFGNTELIRETTRDIWGGRWLEDFIDDVRYGLRAMRKSAGFSVIAVLTLALGIGANTALFSVVNGVLLNPLPYPHPEQLVTLHESKPNFDAGSISFPNFRDWRKDNTTFSMMGAARPSSFSLTGRGDAEQVRGQFVTTDLLPLLGVKPVTGRMFEEGEDAIGAAPIALVSEGFCQRKLGGTEQALGQTLTLDGKAYTIVGVVPSGFRLRVVNFEAADLYVPLGQWNNNLLNTRTAGLGIHGIGRLKAGVNIEQARVDMTRVTQHLAEEYPDANKGIGAALFAMKESMVGRVRLLLLVLLAAVGFVLLIACVNVANLLLVRSAARAREFAVRSALGAARGRLVRQLLTESLMLAIAGGGLGLAMAAAGTRFALERIPAQLPRASEIGMDWKVLLFTAGVVLFCGILFGLAPAMQVSRTQLQDTLKEGARGSTQEKQRARRIFVAAEVAMALVLLIAAGLMIRSLGALWRVDPGFNPQNVLTFGVSLRPSLRGASADAVREALREVHRSMVSVPGVEAVSLSWGAMPLAYDDEDVFWLDGQPKPQSPNDMLWALSYVVEEDYLHLMGIPLLRGRFLNAQDDEHSPHVIVVDEIFAKKYFPDQDPIGKRVHLDVKGGLAEIVGVVGHVNQWGLDSDDKQPLRTQLYFPYMQLPDKAMQLSENGSGVLVRFRGDGQTVAGGIRTALKKVNKDQPMYEVQTMEEIILESLATRRLAMILLGTFAAIALGLAILGIYGVVSYLVRQRTNEIGIRIALGARRSDVLRLVLADGAKMAILGAGIGLAVAAGLTRLMAGMLFGISATDPVTFGGVTLLLLLVALWACYLPARKAMRVDPTVALRYE
jgi:predicted permease